MEGAANCVRAVGRGNSTSAESVPISAVCREQMAGASDEASPPAVTERSSRHSRDSNRARRRHGVLLFFSHGNGKDEAFVSVSLQHFYEVVCRKEKRTPILIDTVWQINPLKWFRPQFSGKKRVTGWKFLPFRLQSDADQFQAPAAAGPPGCAASFTVRLLKTRGTAFFVV